MADLSSYVNISVLMDKRPLVPKFILMDAGVYPPLVLADMTGLWTVTQPDGISATVAAAPPITGVAELPIRLDINSNWQLGDYTVTYALLHPDYEPTEVVFTYDFAFALGEANIVATVNPFVPECFATDLSDYNADGFELNSGLLREWVVTSDRPGDIAAYRTGVSAYADHEGVYYDSRYNFALQTMATWTLINDPRLKIKDLIKKSVTADFYQAESLSSLLQLVSALRNKKEDCGCDEKANFVYAFTLYQTLKEMCGKQGAYEVLLDLYKALGIQLSKKKHTYATITKYDCPDCGCSEPDTGAGCGGLIINTKCLVINGFHLLINE